MVVSKSHHRPSRQQVLFDFDLTRETRSQDPREFQYFLCDAYPPVTIPLDQLEPIQIAELRPNTHHHGRVLYLRNIETPVRLAALQTIVEDDSKDVERLSLYNTDPGFDAAAVLPEDAIFALKEPYYWSDSNGAATLRVDHPSDLLHLCHQHSNIPPGLIARVKDRPQSATEWKNLGNAAYGAQNFLGARHFYTCGLHACKAEDASVRADMLRNRAVVNIFLKRFADAESDAAAAVISDGKQDDRTTALNIKAYERGGHAAYEAGKLSEAENFYKEILQLSPNSVKASRNLQRVAERSRERSTGAFDFERMSRSSSKKNNRLDYSTYKSPTQIFMTDLRGRGLSATRDIKAGGLILVEKALCVAFETDKSPSSYAILNQGTERGITGTQAVLTYKLVEKLSHHRDLALEFFKLFAGSAYPDFSSSYVDDTLPVDTFRVQGIVEHNSFECPSVRSSSHQTKNDSSTNARYRSTGFWLHAAYINHACDGNAMRAFIGDMIIVRAVRDIAEGEEILMPYQLPDAVNTVTQERIQKIWGFHCDCRICKAEADSSFKQRRERTQLIERMRQLLAERASSLPPMSRKAGASSIENLLAKLKATYEGDAFIRTPRLGLVAPEFWLCQGHASLNAHEKVIKIGLAILHDLGYAVSVDSASVSIDRSHGQPEGTVMDAAMYVAHAYRAQGKDAAGAALQEFAQSMYVAMYGELRGFDERYRNQVISS